MTDSTITQNEDFENLVAPEVEVPKTVSAKAAFIAKCLHPPSSVAGFEGLPTNDTRTQVTVEYKGLELMKQPVYYDAKEGAKLPAKRPTTFAQLIPGGGTRVPYISFFKDTDNQGWYQDLGNTVVNNTYDFKDRFCNDVNLYRPCYKSVTTTMNTTMFNNTGMVTGSSFNPPLLFAGTLLQLADSKPELFRHFVISHVRDGKQVLLSIAKHHYKWPKHLRDDMVDIVTRFIRQSAKDAQQEPPSNYGEYEMVNRTQKLNINTSMDYTIDLDPSTTIQFAFLGEALGRLSPVPDATQLLNNDSRATSYPAREGSFTIQHLNSIAPQWKTPGVGGPNARGMGTFLFSCFLAWIDNEDQYHFIQLQDPCPAGTGKDSIPAMFDAQWTNDMTWSWVIWEGLSYNGNQDAVTQQQLIASKWIAGFEYQPAMLSAFAGMSKLAPKPDMKSMETLLRDLYDLKSILPAKYNFLGMLARGAMKVLPTLVKHAPKVLNILGKVSGFADEEEERKEYNKVDYKTSAKEMRTQGQYAGQRAKDDFKRAQRDLQIAQQSRGKRRVKFAKKAEKDAKVAEKDAAVQQKDNAAARKPRPSRSRSRKPNVNAAPDLK